MIVINKKAMSSSTSTIPSIIAIDGPAASGKSTIAKLLADSLDYMFFDTGVMYRAITWTALQREVSIADESAVTSLAKSVLVDIQPASKSDGRTCDVFVENQDITWKIRRPIVDANVSVVSAYPGVRSALAAQQRRIGMRGRVVMVGRDIGTVVLPEANLKIYLDASAEVRARRRFNEIIARNESADYDEILTKIIERDRVDSTRKVAPLKAADDAVIVNSDNLNSDEVFQQIKALCI
ncbi:MAG: (d)CMP kinase [Anaerolineae bacterium]|nr:(d)CMP kinase [Anaerolineae bacterium]